MPSELKKLILDFEYRDFHNELRRFACYCAHQTKLENESWVSVVCTSGKYASGAVSPEVLVRAREKLRSAATAASSIGVRHGAGNAHALLCAFESAHPNAFRAAIEASNHALKWAECVSPGEGSLDALLTGSGITTTTGQRDEMEATLLSYLMTEMPSDPEPFFPDLPITREEARHNADIYLMSGGRRDSSIHDVVHLSEMDWPAPRVYSDAEVYLDFCWVAYLETPLHVIQSSQVVVVCGLTGDVLYMGSAFDEG